MRILTGTELELGKQMMLEAVIEAKKSICGRSLCGSVIVWGDQIIGRGFNSPPGDRPDQRRCDRRNELGPGFKSDRTCCMHAEVRAIIDALRHQPGLIEGARLYFIRLDEAEEIEPAGEPYCTICSKFALDVGLAEFTLWHPAGVTVYDSVEYNDLSFSYGG